MTDDHAGRRRLQPGHWLLIGVVALLATAGAAIVVRRGDASPTVTGATGAPSVAPSSSATPRPDCSPEITATWADVGLETYAFVYASRCDQVVRELRFRVAVVDQAGNEVPGTDTIANGGVLFPDSELAVSRGLQVNKDQKISGLKVQVISFGVYPPADFSSWARAEVVDLARGEPRSSGYFEISGTVQAAPPTAPVCINEFVLIMFDNTGKIVDAASDPTLGHNLPTASFDVYPPKNLDFARTKIYAPQTPRTEQPPRPGLSCNGS